VVIDVLLIAAGTVMLVFGPRIARHSVSLHYSDVEFEAKNRRVRRAILFATASTMAVGLWFVDGGIAALAR
jgi:hypothetical protein